ncbi:MAG: hypothetical protein FJY37_05795 [Betaproteobacteria bacterium]|nr:hypothetical protein [Betaproteobacteria bacterium]
MLRQVLSDLPALIKPLLVLAVSLFISIAVIRISNSSVALAQQARDSQERALSEARNRVRKSGEERDMMQKYLPIYYQLEKEGIVGEERRLDWVEALRVANNHADIYGVQYEISPQRDFAKKELLGLQNVSARQSVMKLRFSLLHEGDLRRFLDALAAQGLGAFIVDQCAVTQMRRPERPANEPNLAAECELSWLTLQVPPATGAAK